VSVHFLSNELGKWDQVAADALVLTVFADERPLRGAAGLADWRLCGQLSRLLKRERFRGERGEHLLMPPGRRLRFARVFVFGLGAAADWSDERYREEIREISAVLAAAGVKSFAIQPPGRATGLVAARRALEVWMEEWERRGDEREVFVVDSPGAQKEMADILHAYQRRAAAKRG